MALKVADAEFAAVSALDATERYAHFVKRVADTEELWSLRAADGWVLAGDPTRELVPVWPHPRYAAACVSGAWAGSEPAVISLEQWLAEWLPGIARDRRAIAVFPVPGGPGKVAEAERLREDLMREVDSYA